MMGQRAEHNGGDQRERAVNGGHADDLPPARRSLEPERLIQYRASPISNRSRDAVLNSFVSDLQDCPEKDDKLATPRPEGEKLPPPRACGE
jgi:hypothetical protein